MKRQNKYIKLIATVIGLFLVPFAPAPASKPYSLPLPFASAASPSVTKIVFASAISSELPFALANGTSFRKALRALARTLAAKAAESLVGKSIPLPEGNGNSKICANRQGHSSPRASQLISELPSLHKRLTSRRVSIYQQVVSPHPSQGSVSHFRSDQVHNCLAICDPCRMDRSRGHEVAVTGSQFKTPEAFHC